MTISRLVGDVMIDFIRGSFMALLAVTALTVAAATPERGKVLEDVKIMSREHAIPLFIVHASQLLNGWQRHDVPR